MKKFKNLQRIRIADDGYGNPVIDEYGTIVFVDEEEEHAIVSLDNGDVEEISLKYLEPDGVEVEPYDKDAGIDVESRVCVIGTAKTGTVSSIFKGTDVCYICLDDGKEAYLPMIRLQLLPCIIHVGDTVWVEDWGQGICDKLYQDKVRVRFEHDVWKNGNQYKLKVFSPKRIKKMTKKDVCGRERKFLDAIKQAVGMNDEQFAKYLDNLDNGPSDHDDFC